MGNVFRDLLNAAAMRWLAKRVVTESVAGLKSASSAIAFLGRELALPNDDLPIEIRRRGIACWESRLAAALAPGRCALLKRLQSRMGAL